MTETSRQMLYTGLIGTVSSVDNAQLPQVLYRNKLQHPYAVNGINRTIDHQALTRAPGLKRGGGVLSLRASRDLLRTTLLWIAQLTQ